MQNEVYKYNPEKQCLDPWMEKPKGIMTDNTAGYYKDLKEYEKHIASLKSYDTPHTDWPTGELREGEHFEVVPCTGNVIGAFHFDHEKQKETYTSYLNGIAVPLSPSRSQENGEDELWHEVLQEYADSHPDLFVHAFKETIDKLKSKYKIQKR